MSFLAWIFGKARRIVPQSALSSECDDQYSLNEDHMSIVKPSSKDSDIHRWLRERIAESQKLVGLRRWSYIRLGENEPDPTVKNQIKISELTAERDTLRDTLDTMASENKKLHEPLTEKSTSLNDLNTTKAKLTSELAQERERIKLLAEELERQRHQPPPPPSSGYCSCLTRAKKNEPERRLCQHVLKNACEKRIGESCLVLARMAKDELSKGLADTGQRKFSASYFLKALRAGSKQALNEYEAGATSRQGWDEICSALQSELKISLGRGEAKGRCSPDTGSFKQVIESYIPSQSIAPICR